MSIASEAAVTSLMSHMHEVETRRRLVMIRLKDGETRAAHAAEELAVEKKNVEQLMQREESLKHQLRLLSEEQALSAIRQNTAFATLRHVEQEEPLLLQHASMQLAHSKVVANTWQQHLATLDGLTAAWSSDSLTAPLRKQLDAQRAELEALEQEEALLLQEAAQLSAQLSPPNAAAHPSLSLAPAVAVLEVVDGPEEIAALERELAEVRTLVEEQKAVNVRQRQSWDKEIENLRSRISELQQWISSTDAQAVAIRSDTAILRQLVDQSLCRACA